MATIAATDYSMPIGGEWVESDGGRFDVTNPATGEVVGTAVNATADDVTPRDRRGRGRRSARGRRWPRSSAGASCAAQPTASWPRPTTSPA